MEEEEEETALILTLFDFYWFDNHILKNPPPPPPPIRSPPMDSSNTQTRIQDHPVISRLQSLHRRSQSADLVSRSDSALLPHRQPPRKLHPIPSGKELRQQEEEEEEERGDTSSGVEMIGGGYTRRRRKRKEKMGGKSKSLSELEFEELKGLMDLGFSFSEAEASNPKLVSIVPGLQRLLGKQQQSEKEEEEEEIDESGISRPYLSESWAVAVDSDIQRRKKKEEEAALKNWRIPASGEEVDIKDHLRFWAHTVASTVR